MHVTAQISVFLFQFSKPLRQLSVVPCYCQVPSHKHNHKAFRKRKLQTEFMPRHNPSACLLVFLVSVEFLQRQKHNNMSVSLYQVELLELKANTALVTCQTCGLHILSSFHCTLIMVPLSHAAACGQCDASP